MLAIPSNDNNYHREHVLLLLQNLKRWTGFDLIAEYGFSLDTLGAQVFNAQFYLLSHNNAADPILTYGNQQVLSQWEVSWAELITMHSRETAKPIDRAERAAMMERVKADNYINGYSGVRISKTGKEFTISDGIVWNVFTENGDFCGQAAWFKEVETRTIDMSLS
ncbi:MEKHLA domain-containing protein [Chamaesiphon minutus]|uniref:MEKHLA domain-containing protein n=1 Tax=Chamaesiphon minutus (strain ATCC 27169 / PCC 6605) TaxID=1173020 RepID=K9UGT8_CHAP6|nr:MEKHLA domain-containing protein [Chamaesiphon minutus]AFY94312.1 MEKHLA domain-containing protein [Chamaesiphon minutus PCC 6605]